MSHAEFAAFIRAARWQYAKTMPTIPHTYTTREWVDNDAQFEAAAIFIREHGVIKPWGRYRHTYYELDGFQYWTMGAPISETTIINCEKLEPATYDDIAPVYDTIFNTDEARQEEQKVYDLIREHLTGTVLDIGCGTGLLLDLHPTIMPGYVGVDPSKAMLALFNRKHPEYAGQVIWNKFEYARLGTYDLVVSLFGSMNYVAPSAVDKIGTVLAQAGKYFLMYYAHGYRPVTYDKSGLCVKHYATSKKRLGEQFASVDGNRVIPFGNYLIATNL